MHSLPCEYLRRWLMRQCQRIPVRPPSALKRANCPTRTAICQLWDPSLACSVQPMSYPSVYSVLMCRSGIPRTLLDERTATLQDLAVHVVFTAWAAIPALCLLKGQQAYRGRWSAVGHLVGSQLQVAALANSAHPCPALTQQHPLSVLTSCRWQASPCCSWGVAGSP